MTEKFCFRKLHRLLSKPIAGDESVLRIYDKLSERGVLGLAFREGEIYRRGVAPVQLYK